MNAQLLRLRQLQLRRLRRRTPLKHHVRVNANSVTLSGEIADIEPLRHTPAGLPLVTLRFMHRSLQVEAGMQRQTDFEVGAVAIGEAAATAAKLKAGDRLTVQGFLAA